MKTLTNSLEGKVDQVVHRWIEPKACHYLLKSAFELLPCVTFIVVPFLCTMYNDYFQFGNGFVMEHCWMKV